MTENELKQNEIGYQFTAVPTNLFLCCDNNVRSMLFTLVQLSSYFADDEGWFFRTNDDLRAESNLSENIVRATLSVLFENGIIDVKTVGKSNWKHSNKFKINFDSFKKWERLSIDDAMKNPQYKIETPKYKNSGWQPTYLKVSEVVEENSPNTQTHVIPTLGKSEDNIDNKDNTENKNNISMSLSADGENKLKFDAKAAKSKFDEYKEKEDYLLDKLYNVKYWSDYCMYRRDISNLIMEAPSTKCVELTKKRYNTIKEGKMKYFIKKVEGEPYNSFYDDLYKETGCGWLGKETKPVEDKVQEHSQQKSSMDDEEINAITRNALMGIGMAVPLEAMPKPKEQVMDKAEEARYKRAMRQRYIEEGMEVPQEYQMEEGEDDDLPF